MVGGSHTTFNISERILTSPLLGIRYRNRDTWIEGYMIEKEVRRGQEGEERDLDEQNQIKDRSVMYFDSWIFRYQR